MDTKSPFEIWDFEGYARQQLRRYAALASLDDAATDADKTAAATWREILGRIERDDVPGAFGIAYVGFGATDPFVLLLRAAQAGDHESGTWNESTGIYSRGIKIPAKPAFPAEARVAELTPAVTLWTADHEALGCKFGTFTLADLADRARDMAGSTYADHSIALNQIHARVFGLDVPTEPMPMGTAAADETVRRVGIILAALDAASHALALARTAAGKGAEAPVLEPKMMTIEPPPIDADRVAAMVEKILQERHPDQDRVLLIAGAKGGSLPWLPVEPTVNTPERVIPAVPHEPGWWWMQIPRGIHGDKVWTPVEVRRATAHNLLAIIDGRHEAVSLIAPEFWGPRIPYPFTG